jgi:hypothetical protein
MSFHGGNIGLNKIFEIALETQYCFGLTELYFIP